VKVLITGADGQLARALVFTAPAEMEVRAVNRTQCDITESSAVERVFRSFEPEIVINTAAYTAVDAAEDNQELAFRVNARGAENVAKAAESVDARVIHISTDYVFDGHRATPYPPDAPTNPTSVYGASKLEGERLVLGVSPRAAIVRAGWLYSTTGKNFLVSMLAALRGSQPLLVVRDQVGCPTSAHEFALAIWKMSGFDLRGIYHWANSGSASRYDFAREIARTAHELGLLRTEREIRPVTTGEYPRRANRPAYSVLDANKLAGLLGISPSPWQQALRRDMARDISTLTIG
jgi:dTDP-4-dehydrorhamnose reductase